MERFPFSDTLGHAIFRCAGIMLFLGMFRQSIQYFEYIQDAVPEPWTEVDIMLFLAVAYAGDNRQWCVLPLAWLLRKWCWCFGAV